MRTWMLLFVLFATTAFAGDAEKPRPENVVSDETKMALPTADEMANFEKIARKAALTKSTDGGEMGEVLNRLRAEPEKWNDADFKARLAGEAKIVALWAHVNTHVEHVPKAWATYAGSADKMDVFLKRVLDGTAEIQRVGKNVPANLIDGWVASAIDTYMEKHSDLIKDDADKKKFLFWLRDKKVSVGALNLLLKGLK